MSPLTSAEVGALKFALAACTAALLLWGIALRRRGRAAAFERPRDALLAALAVASGFGWFNFGEMRYSPGYGHPLEVYHYYIGAKYFDELGYTRLYECTTVAEAESGGRAQASRRSIRNLENYRRESAAIILADPERCTRHFSPARWQLFTQDIGWFRERIPEGLWRGALSDYGYNPSPVWGTLAHAFIGAGPVSEGSLAPVLLVDPILLLAMWLFVWRSFGWRTACVGLVFFGTNLPADYLWTGGGFLRQLWLAALLIGLCCLRLGRFGAGGFLLGVSALLRIFPGVAIAAVAAGAALNWWRQPNSEGASEGASEAARFGVGVVAAIALLVPLSFAVAGGPAAWSAFAEKILFHAGTLFATNVGLRNFLAGVTDSGQSLVLGVAALAYGVLLLRAVGGVELWVAAAIGCGAVVILTSMSSYYYPVLLGFALLWHRRESVGVLLCALSAAGWCIQWNFERTDRVYVWLSLATVICVFAVTALMGRAATPSASETAANPGSTTA